MKYGSLFSGVGGFDLGFEQAGLESAWQVEIDKDCQRVLRRHWPNIELFDDVKTIGKLSDVDVLCGGFPCQDLSVAGKRAGLAGERSGLWFEFLRIAERNQPRWLVIENVPGLLSSDEGRDFAAILRGLVNVGYRIAWRVTDAQYFGVAQRRRRVFIVGSLGDGSCAEILFESEGMSGDSPPRREAGAGVASTFKSRARSGGWGCDVELAAGGYMQPVTSHRMAAFGEYVDDGTASSLKRRDFKDATDLVIAAPITASYGKQLDNSDRNGGPPNLIAAHDTGQGWWNQSQIAGTLRSEGENRPSRPSNVVTAFHENKSGQLSEADVLGLRSGASHSYQGVGGNFGVRRLTPRECERLQGFPDDWTRYDSEGKEISDSARYRMLGNAVAVPNARWIGERLATFA